MKFHVYLDKKLRRAIVGNEDADTIFASALRRMKFLDCFDNMSDALMLCNIVNYTIRTLQTFPFEQ